MPARTVKRPRIASPNATDTKSDQESQVAQARLNFIKILNRNRRGALDIFTNLPLDILYEVFAKCHPRDLYNLSFTNKMFCDILFRRRYIFIWKTAFANTPELPPCPEDIIEPVWAKLFYSSSCMLCGQPNVSSVTWECLARLCDGCMKELLISDCRVHTILRKAQYEQFKILVEYPRVFVKVPVVPGLTRPGYVKSHLHKVMKAWEELPEPRDLPSFVTEWQNHAQDRQQFVARCKAYMTLETNNRRQELLAIRDQRLEDICEGLRALGWGPEVEHVKGDGFKRFRGIEAVWLQSELTSTEWRDLRDDLVDCVKAVRAELRAKKLAGRWALFAQVGTKLLNRSSRRHPDMAAYRFTLQDLAMQDEVRQILDVADDVEITREDFHALEGQFEKIFKRWRAGVCKQLRDSAAKSKGSSGKEMDPLQLATTVFSVCRHGHGEEPEYALFPFVTAHRCIRNSLTGATDAYERFVHRHSARPSGQTCHYVGCADLRQAEVTPSMRKIVHLFGLNPDTATVAQMDAVDARLVVNWRDCMTWRAAMKEAVAGKVSLMKLATERELPKIKRREKQLRNSIQVKAWICGRCDGFVGPKDRESIETHLKNAHGIQPKNAVPKDIIFLEGLAQELMTDSQLVIKWSGLR